MFSYERGTHVRDEPASGQWSTVQRLHRRLLPMVDIRGGVDFCRWLTFGGGVALRGGPCAAFARARLVQGLLEIKDTLRP